MDKAILVVDDSRSIRQMMALTLQDAGFEVIEASDGADALKQLNGRRVSLIISDLHMPNIDGIEMTRKVRKMPSYRFVPIIMMTTESGNNKKSEALQAGVKCWMTKPFNPNAMLNTVAKYTA